MLLPDNSFQRYPATVLLAQHRLAPLCIGATNVTASWWNFWQVFAVTEYNFHGALILSNFGPPSPESGSPARPRPPRSSAPNAQQRPSRIPLGEAMSGVITKFAVTSMFMWMAPIAIMYGFYLLIISGVGQLSSSAQTLASGFLAVISVNIVIGFYIYSAMKETSCQEPQPDATFLANAKASINQTTSSQVSDDSQGKGKLE